MLYTSPRTRIYLTPISLLRRCSKNVRSLWRKILLDFSSYLNGILMDLSPFD